MVLLAAVESVYSTACSAASLGDVNLTMSISSVRVAIARLALQKLPSHDPVDCVHIVAEHHLVPLAATVAAQQEAPPDYASARSDPELQDLLLEYDEATKRVFTSYATSGVLSLRAAARLAADIQLIPQLLSIDELRWVGVYSPWKRLYTSSLGF